MDTRGEEESKNLSPRRWRMMSLDNFPPLKKIGSDMSLTLKQSQQSDKQKSTSSTMLNESRLQWGTAGCRCRAIDHPFVVSRGGLINHTALITRWVRPEMRSQGSIRILQCMCMILIRYAYVWFDMVFVYTERVSKEKLIMHSVCDHLFWTVRQAVLSHFTLQKYRYLYRLLGFCLKSGERTG